MSSKNPTTKQSSQADAAKTSAGAAKKKVSKKKASTRAKAASAVSQPTARESTDLNPAANGATQAKNGMTRLALIASLLAMAIAAYAAYQFTLSGSVTKAQVSALEERLAFAVQQQQSLQSTFDQQNQVLTTDSKQFSDKLAGMQSTVDELQRQSELSMDDIKANLGESVARWKLDEQHSLLTRINRAYQLTGDQAQAIAGLKLARASLATIDNPRLEAVKAALAEDILQVESARHVDIASLHNRLLGMSRMIPDLVLAEDSRVEQPPVEGAADPDDAVAVDQDTGILAAGKTLMSDIGGLVKYKNLDAPLQPSLGDEARYVVYESLNLKLQAAMAALLRRNNTAYQAQLSLAEDALNGLFDLEQAEVITMLDQLEVMRSYDISLDVDSISRALSALDRVIVIEN